VVLGIIAILLVRLCASSVDRDMPTLPMAPRCVKHAPQDVRLQVVVVIIALRAQVAPIRGVPVRVVVVFSALQGNKQMAGNVSALLAQPVHSPPKAPPNVNPVVLVIISTSAAVAVVLLVVQVSTLPEAVVYAPSAPPEPSSRNPASLLVFHV
jgi:hypothetical protein